MSVIFIAAFLVLLVPLAVFYVWALVDALRTSTGTWEAAEQNQLVWIAVLLIVPLLGAVLYMLVARPRLLEARGGSIGPAAAVR